MKNIISMAYGMFGVVNNRNRRFFFVVLFGLIIYILFGCHDSFKSSRNYFYNEVVDQAFRTHMDVIERFYKERQDWKTSTLGSWLFKNKKLPNIDFPQNRSFEILVWKHWEWLKNRHVYNFGSSKSDPLESCSVKNCIFTGEDEKLGTADAVVIHLQRGAIPDIENRKPQQKWIFLNDESPINAFSLSGNIRSYKDLTNVFNWSMTFRSNADIPVPYGRTVPLDKPVFETFTVDISTLIPNWKKKRRDVLAAILISNCGVKFRMNFIKQLQEYLPVDVYGHCSNNQTTKNRCPGHFKSDCEVMSEYLFYLVLENSSCREYMTEKIWYHAYSKGAIPVIMGPSEQDCKTLLPPNSYIHMPVTSDKSKIKELAEKIMYLSKNEYFVLNLHSWRNHFKIINEHGYFGTRSYHLCRICEALNYNDLNGKVYSESDLQLFLDPNLLCNNNTKV